MRVRSEFLRFAIVGISNTILGLAVIVTLQGLVGFSPTLANACGYAFGAVLGFFLHRRWTFNFAAVSISDRAFVYGMVLAACYLINLAVLHAALAAGASPVVSQALAVVAYSASHFSAGKWLAFPSRIKRP